MKAAICMGYGSPDMIKVMELPTPNYSKDEVLIKVMASAVNSGDIRTRGLMVNPVMKIVMRMVLGIRKPRKPILGVALAGEIVAVGEDVTNFKVGDQIFAMTGMRFGGHAQFAVLKEKSAMSLKPKQAPFEEAAVLPFGGTTALHFLKKAQIGEGQQVLIYGASGAVGTSAIQIAKYFGTKVTGVCSERHTQTISKLGADQIVDYHNDAYLKMSQQFDLIFDAVGKIKKSQVEHLLKPNGRFISVAGYGVAAEKIEDLQLLAQMYDEGKLNAVIDRTFTLDDIVLAHHYVDQGVKTGNVAITIAHD